MEIYYFFHFGFFIEFKENIVNRGIRKEKYLDFLNSIKEDMESLDTVRNCVAHNRTPTDEEIINYERAVEEIRVKFDNFTHSFSVGD